MLVQTDKIVKYSLIGLSLSFLSFFLLYLFLGIFFEFSPTGNSFISPLLLIPLIAIFFISLIGLIASTIFGSLNSNKIHAYEIEYFKRTFCFNCGQKISSEDDFCQNCGNKLDFRKN